MGCGRLRGSGLTDKVVLVGDQNVGKTCLVLRYCEDSFWENYKATIGVDFMWQRYLIQGIGFTLHLWDTAGQEKFRSLSQAYYRGARACIAAFDLGVPESLEHCKHVRAWPYSGTKVANRD
jgi:small GTP-binding protein